MVGNDQKINIKKRFIEVYARCHYLSSTIPDKIFGTK